MDEQISVRPIKLHHPRSPCNGVVFSSVMAFAAPEIKRYLARKHRKSSLAKGRSIETPALNSHRQAGRNLKIIISTTTLSSIDPGTSSSWLPFQSIQHVRPDVFGFCRLNPTDHPNHSRPSHCWLWPITQHAEQPLSTPHYSAAALSPRNHKRPKIEHTRKLCCRRAVTPATNSVDTLLEAEGSAPFCPILVHQAFEDLPGFLPHVRPTFGLQRRHRVLNKPTTRAGETSVSAGQREGIVEGLRTPPQKPHSLLLLLPWVDTSIDLSALYL